MSDEGATGTWEPKVVEGNYLKQLRDIAGPPPFDGKKWVMVNLATGELKWYKSNKKKSYNSGWKYGRR